MIKGSIHHPQNAGFAGMKNLRVITPESSGQDQIQNARVVRSMEASTEIAKKTYKARLSVAELISDGVWIGQYM